MEYEVIRSQTLAKRRSASTKAARGSRTTTSYAKGWCPSHEVRTPCLNIRVNPQRRSLKGILLLFISPYTPGNRDSEYYCNPDITKVAVTVNSVPNRVYNEGISDSDMWEELTRHFKPSTNGRPT